MTVIPAVNAASFAEAKAQLEKIAGLFSEPRGRFVHIDITDGKFTLHETWGTPEDYKELIASYLKSGMQFEVHLMVQNPELVLNSWLAIGIQRVILHVEAMSDAEIITDQCRAVSVEAMLSANLETPIQELVKHSSEFSAFQILAVAPGKAGQIFSPEAFQKISSLRAAVPRATIEVDGGITREVAAAVKNAGANIVVSASYILENKNPSQAFRELSQI